MKTALTLLAATLSLAAASAVAAPLFADSHTVVTPRFSDEIVGKGPDLVFIPGLASSRETWKATAERLKGHYRLHLIQVAGFAGESARANAEGPVLVPTAEAIDAYIVAQHLAPATVIGHSLGGTMTLWLAENRPQDLRKALVVDALPWVAQVFISPNVTADQAKAAGEAMRVSPPMPEAARSQMIDNMVSGPADRAMVLAWGKASDTKVVSNALADDMEMDLRAGLGAVKTPITLLYPDNLAAGMPAGAMDGFYHAAFAAASTVKLERVDSSRHFIMLDQPAAFAAALDAFLAN
jgi:pimeloyl-ACP methyl ester carboxylesterase